MEEIVRIYKKLLPVNIGNNVIFLIYDYNEFMKLKILKLYKKSYKNKYDPAQIWFGQENVVFEISTENIYIKYNYFKNILSTNELNIVKKELKNYFKKTIYFVDNKGWLI